MSMELKLTKAEQAALSAEMRRIGSLGGQATARKMSMDWLRMRALKGVKTRAAKLTVKTKLIAGQEESKVAR